MSKMKNDPRIDPRIKAVLGDMPAIAARSEAKYFAIDSSATSFSVF